MMPAGVAVSGAGAEQQMGMLMRKETTKRGMREVTKRDTRGAKGTEAVAGAGDAEVGAVGAGAAITQ